MSVLRLLMTVLALTFLSGGATAQATNPSGRWLLRVDGRILVMLDLRPASGSRRAWSGTMARPARLQIAPGGSPDGIIILGVEGPVIERAVTGVSDGEGIALRIANSEGGEDQWRLTFEEGRARLALAEPMPAGAQPVPPLPLVRADERQQIAADWSPERRYFIGPELASNAEMRAIFDADQADRRAPPAVDWAAVGPRDEARRVRTRQLLDSGSLQSGDDFWHAAFVFQHGREPDDYLLAHTLAVIAAARGRPDATWIAAATLDRYLQRIGQRQIYGTQYSTMPGQPTTQDPYDRALVSDALRQALRVPTLAEQERRRAEFEAQHRPPADRPAQ